MQSFTINKSEKTVTFKDQNKTIVKLVRFVFGLNVLNAIIFFLIFNNQNDAFKWIWLVFALFNVAVLYLTITKLSVSDKLKLSEIEKIEAKPILGLMFKLANGKYRKAFVPKGSKDAEKLMKIFNK